MEIELFPFANIAIKIKYLPSMCNILKFFAKKTKDRFFFGISLCACQLDCSISFLKKIKRCFTLVCDLFNNQWTATFWFCRKTSSENLQARFRGASFGLLGVFIPFLMLTTYLISTQQKVMKDILGENILDTLGIYLVRTMIEISTTEFQSCWLNICPNLWHFFDLYTVQWWI